LAAIVSLHQRDRWWRGLARFQHASEAQGPLQPDRDFGLHIRKLFLHQLIGSERATKLFSIQRILPGTMPAELGSPHGAPGHSVARIIEAAERASEAFHVGQ